MLSNWVHGISIYSRMGLTPGVFTEMAGVYTGYLEKPLWTLSSDFILAAVVTYPLARFFGLNNKVLLDW